MTPHQQRLIRLGGPRGNKSGRPPGGLPAKAKIKKMQRELPQKDVPSA